jgi:outer membrane protein
MKTKTLTFCVLVTCSLSAIAQDTTSVLTFKDAVRIALQNNVTLNQQRNTLFQSQVNKTYRIAQLGPQVSVNASAGQNSGNNFIPNEGRLVNDIFYGVNASLNVQMPIFNGLAGINSVRQASNQFDAQLEQVNRSSQDVINIVATQYLQVLLDKELLKIAQENLVVQKTQYEQVKVQVALGSLSPVDEYNQQALVSNAEVRVALAEQTLTNDQTNLLQSLLVDPTIKRRVEEPSWDVNAIVLDNLDLNSLLSVAEANRSDLKQARYIEKASKYGMQASKGNYLPSLNASYSNGSAYQQVKGARRDTITYRDFNEQFRSDKRFNTVGLSLNIPIFSGFQNRAFYVQSKVQYDNNKLATKNREVLVKGDVMRAYENFESVQKAYSASLTGLEASEVAYNLERERFNLGITSFVDFANANRAYLQAQTDMAQAKYRFLFQKIMVDYAVGTLKVEDIPN